MAFFPHQPRNSVRALANNVVKYYNPGTKNFIRS